MFRILVAALGLLVAMPAAAQLSLERVGDFIPLEHAFLEGGPLFVYTDLGAFRANAAAADRLMGIPLELHPMAVPPLGRDALRTAVGIQAPAIGRVLDYGIPPRRVLVLTGEAAMAEPEAVAAALGGRGFSRLEEGQRVVWYRGEDNGFDPALREPADPFGGDVGHSARIAVRPGEMVGARDWASLRQGLAAIDGTAPTVAVLPQLAAALNGAAAAAAERGLTVLQATGFKAADVAFPPPDLPIGGSMEEFAAAAEEAMKPPDPADVLPLYGFAVLADLAGPQANAAVIALSYPAAEPAATAARILARRLAATGATSVDATVVELGASGDRGGAAWSAVAVAASPADEGTRYRKWINQAFRLELRLIALEP
jgi:hypothetical protein